MSDATEPIDNEEPEPIGGVEPSVEPQEDGYASKHGTPLSTDQMKNYEWYGQLDEPAGADLRLPFRSKSKDAALEHLWRDSKNRNLDEEADVLRIARITGTGAELVRENLDSFKDAIGDSTFGVHDIRNKHPDLYRILGKNPNLSAGVRRAVVEDLSWFSKKMRMAQADDDMHDEWARIAGYESGKEFGGEIELARRRIDVGSNPVMDALFAIGSDSPKGILREQLRAGMERQLEASKKEAGTPGIIDAVIDPIAKEEPGLLKSYKVMGMRIDATSKQFEASDARADLAYAYLFSGDSERVRDLRARADSLRVESEIVTYYGKEGVLGNLNDAVAGAQSSVGSMGAGALGVGSALVIGTVGGALMGGPKGALAGLKMGVKMLPFAYAATSSPYSFNREFGSFLMQVDHTVSDSGVAPSENEKIATAAIYATMATSVELTSDLLFGLPAFGVLGKIVATGDAKLFSKIFTKIPALKSIIGDITKRLAKRSLAEGAEEGVQEAMSEVSEYALKSLLDVQWNSPRIYESIDAIVHSASVGLQTGLLMESASRVAGLAGTSVIRKLKSTDTFTVMAEEKKERERIHDSFVGVERVSSIIEAAKSETGNGSPDVIEKMAEENSEPGLSPTMFIGTESIEAEARSRGVSAASFIEALDGESGVVRYVDAVESGAKYEVPVSAYADRWVKTGAADALIGDTTDRSRNYSILDVEKLGEDVDLKQQELEGLDLEESESLAEVTGIDQVITPAEQGVSGVVEGFESGVRDAAESSEKIAVAAGDIASVNRAHAHVSAERVGLDPIELFEGTILGVKSEENTDGEAIVQDTESEENGGAEIQGEASSVEDGATDRGGVQQEVPGSGDAESDTGSIDTVEQGIERVKDEVADSVVKKVAGKKKTKKKTKEKATKKKTTKKKVAKKKVAKKKKVPSATAKRKVTGPHNKPWKSMYSAWEELLVSIGGTDQSPSRHEDDLYRKYELAEAVRSKKAKADIKEKRAAKKAGEPAPPSIRGRVAVARPSAWSGGEFDEPNKQLEGGHKVKAKFKRVSGAYEAFHRMVGNETTWDSQKAAEAVTALRASDGFENLHIPEEAMAAMDEEQFIKEQAEERGLDPETFEVLQQTRDGDVLGFTEILKQGTNRAYNIFIEKHADVATMLHEQSHVYFDMLESMSKGVTPAGKKSVKLDPKQAARDMEIALDYLGAESAGALTKAQKELWAESFEKYFIEGKSPSSKLEGVFARLSIILQEIYRHTKDLLGIELTDDIRGVFDRMLATDREISITRKKLGLLGRISDKALSSVASKVAADLYSQRQDALSDLADRRMASARGAARKEYYTLPATKARSYITRNGSTEGFDFIAGMFGFSSPDAMNLAMDENQDVKAYVLQRGEQIARERHPEMFDERARMEKKVVDALHHADKVDGLLEEHRLMARKAGVTNTPNKKEMQRQASDAVGRMSSRRLSLDEVINLEKRAAVESERAAARGNPVRALEFKAKQILNHYIWKEVRRARSIRESFVKTASRFARDESIARLGRSGVEFRDVVLGMVEAMGFRGRVDDHALVDRKSPTDLAKRMGGSAIFNPDLLSSMIYGQQVSWQEMNMAQIESALLTLRNIGASARDALKVKVGDKAELVSWIQEELIRESRENLKNLGVVRSKEGSALADIYKAGKTLGAGIDARLIRPQTIIDMLGGGSIGSMWNNAIFLPMQKASDLEADLTSRILEPAFKEMENMPSPTKRRWSKRVDMKEIFPDLIDGFEITSFYEILVMAMHLGTHSSRERLLSGLNITEAQVMRAISMLTEQELKWVQRVWDSFDKLWPDMASIYEEERGVAPHRLTNSNFSVMSSDGVMVKMTGGYMPAIYDSRLYRTQAELTSIIEDETMLGPSRPTVNQSHLKSRQENPSAPLSLDPDVIQSGLARAIHYTAFRAPLKAVQTIMMDQRVLSSMRERVGPERTAALEGWLTDLGGQGANANAYAPYDTINNVLRKGKNNFTTSLLSYAIRVALPDVINVVAAPLASDIKSRYAAAGTVKLMANPVAARKFAIERSGVLRRLTYTIDQEFRNSLNRMKEGHSLPQEAFNFVKDNGFVFMQFINNGVATSLWLGAYQQIADNGGSQEQAIRFAESIVSKSTPSFSTVDKPALARDKGIAGHLTVFWGYFSMLYSQYRRIWHEVHQAEGFIPTSKAVMSALLSHLALTFLTAHVANLIMGRGPSEGEEWPRWMLRNMVSGTLAPLPFGIGYMADSLILGKPAPGIKAPGAILMEEGWKFFQEISKDEINPRLAAEKAAKAAAIATGAPLEIGRGAMFLFDALTGEKLVEDVGDVVGGVIFKEGDSHIFNLFDPDNSR